jgi:hypothetical protein
VVSNIQDQVVVPDKEAIWTILRLPLQAWKQPEFKEEHPFL